MGSRDIYGPNLRPRRRIGPKVRPPLEFQFFIYASRSQVHNFQPIAQTFPNEQNFPMPTPRMSISIPMCTTRRRLGKIPLFPGDHRISLQCSRPGHSDLSASSLPASASRHRVPITLALLVSPGAIFIAPQAIFFCNCSDSAGRYTAGRFSWANAVAHAHRKSSGALFARIGPRVTRCSAFQIWCSKSGLRPPGRNSPTEICRLEIG